MSKEKQMIEKMAKVIKSSLDGLGCGNFNFTGDEISTMFAEALYTAGYRKQSEGEWKYPPYAPFGGSYEMKRCSVCGYKPDFDSDHPYTKFCPNCGAKMKGV